MATTTTNFGWDIPQSTDLVKDGADAIAGLGQDIDTALVDLKGGTTGQFLTKASGTDLDFSWGSASGGDLTRITKVSFTGSSAVNIDNCFSSTYDFYVIQMKASIASGANTYLYYRMRSGGTNNTASTYSHVNTYATYNTTAPGNDGLGSQSQGTCGYFRTTDQSYAVVEMRNPFNAEYTTFFNASPDVGAGGLFQGIHATKTSFDGISLYPSGSTITGELNIYGYKKG
jgi:hypothetical protein